MSELWLSAVITPAGNYTNVNRRALASVTSIALAPALAAPLACEFDAFGTTANTDTNRPPVTMWFRFRHAAGVWWCRSDVVQFSVVSSPPPPDGLPARVTALEAAVAELRAERS